MIIDEIAQQEHEHVRYTTHLPLLPSLTALLGNFGGLPAYSPQYSPRFPMSTDRAAHRDYPRAGTMGC